MSREEKQIEEMAHDLCGRCQDGICVVDGKPCNLDLDCTCQINATTLYNAGYRKQRTAEWIEAHGETYIPVECDENVHLILHNYTVYVCSACGRAESKKEPYCNCGAKMKGI